MEIERSEVARVRRIFPYLVLSQVIVTLILQFIIFYKCIQWIRTKVLFFRCSPTLKLLILYSLILCVSLIGYCSYIIIFWRPNKILYNEERLYQIGILSWILMVSNPIFDLCICIEHCVIVCFPLKYTRKWKNFMAIFSINLLLLFVIIYFWVVDIDYETSWNQNACRFFTCVLFENSKRNYLILRIILSSINVLAAIVLLFLMKFKTRLSNLAAKRKNYAIFINIFITVLFELGPNLFDFFFNLVRCQQLKPWIYNYQWFQFSFHSLASYIGPYRTTVTSMNVLVVILMYQSVFKHLARRTTVRHVDDVMKSIVRTSDI